jgi:hypothetical protein
MGLYITLRNEAKLQEFYKTTKKAVVYGLLAVILALAFTACGGGGKSLNSAEALKEYLDKQPANSPDKPIKVSMSVNDLMIGSPDSSIAEVLMSASKYVSLDLSKSAGLTRIWIEGCETLAGIIIPNSVTYVEFENCPNLTSITFQGTIPSQCYVAGDLGDLAGGAAGTYTTKAPVNWDSKWTKQ